MREFQKVFPDDLPRIPPKQEIDLVIDLMPDAKLILISPYGIALAGLKEFKAQFKDFLYKGLIQKKIVEIQYHL